jgi:hypothetical protein
MALLPLSRTASLRHLSLAAGYFGRVAFHSGLTFEPYARDQT